MKDFEIIEIIEEHAGSIEYSDLKEEYAQQNLNKTLAGMIACGLIEVSASLHRDCLYINMLPVDSHVSPVAYSLHQMTLYKDMSETSVSYLCRELMVNRVQLHMALLECEVRGLLSYSLQGDVVTIHDVADFRGGE